MSNVYRGYADHASGQLHYRYWGSRSDGTPWVLLHHSASDSRSLIRLGDALSDRGLAAIAFDTPGFGMSDPIESQSVDGLARALMGGLHSLGIVKWSVFGHHSGASIALRMAAEGDEFTERAVLSGILLPDPTDRERLSKPLRPLAVDSDGSHLMSAWERVSRYTPHAPLDVLTRETVALLNAHEPHLVYEEILRYDSRTDLGRVSCPVLVLCGEGEYLAGSTPVAAALVGNGRWQLIAGAGLDVHETHPDQVADSIADFVFDIRVGQ
ncbi:MAG: alpha/beta hydrolase [Cryobacterium sp.]|nr:alpha/beta hydrolase [Cryobacterium sp.]